METDSGKDSALDSKPMATLYYAEHVHIAQTLIRIPIPYFCVGQESESESISESISRNINESLLYLPFSSRLWLFRLTGF